MSTEEPHIAFVLRFLVVFWSASHLISCKPICHYVVLYLTFAFTNFIDTWSALMIPFYLTRISRHSIASFFLFPLVEFFLQWENDWCDSLNNTNFVLIVNLLYFASWFFVSMWLPKISLVLFLGFFFFLN